MRSLVFVKNSAPGEEHQGRAHGVNVMTVLERYLEPYEHVIWDWNGTLLSDVEYAVQTVNLSLAKRQLPMIDTDVYKKTFVFLFDLITKIGLPTEGDVFDELCRSSSRTSWREFTLVI